MSYTETHKQQSGVLLTIPSLEDPGGVAGYYSSLLPHLGREVLTVLEIGGTRNACKWMHPLADQIRFRRCLCREKPALIHINPSLNLKSFLRDGLFAWQAKRLGYPLLVFWRGWEKDFERKVEGPLATFFRHTFGRADSFVVLASDFEQQLRKWGVTVPVYRETTCVAEQLVKAVDVEKKWRNTDLTGPVKVLFLARLEPGKGARETIQAVKILLDQGRDVQLTIAGCGSIRQELEEFARSLFLSPRQVRFTGYIKGREKIRILGEQHIYCFPSSFGEGLPNSIVEAMAFGLPVVTRPVGGVADFFEEEKMGWLVKGTSSGEIAACLERFIADRESMVRVGIYNAEFARKNFLASVAAGRLLDIYAALGVDTGCMERELQEDDGGCAG